MYQRIINFIKDVEVSDVISNEEKNIISEFCENKVLLEFSKNEINIENSRAKNIKKAYVDTKSFKDTTDFECGSQIEYEIEEDLNTMKWAVEYLSEYLEYRDKKNIEITFGDKQCNNALNLLIERISQYSCISNLKPELRRRKKCKFKDKCKIFDCL